MAAAFVRARIDTTLSGHLLAGRVLRHRRDVVFGEPLAAGAGRAARSPGRQRRDGRGDRRRARLLHPLGGRAVPRLAGARELRDAPRARGDPGDRCALSDRRHARGARHRRQVVGRLRRAGAGHAPPRALRRRRQPRGRHGLRAVGAQGSSRRRAHLAPARRRPLLRRALRGQRKEERRRLHDDDGAGPGGRLFARGRPAGRRGAPLRRRDRRRSTGRSGSAGRPGTRSSWWRRTPRRCAG